MPALHNDVYDFGLSVIPTNTEKLVVLSGDPGLTWANIAAYKLGEKSLPEISSPTDRTYGGRKVTVSAIADGSVLASGIGSHYALTDDSASKVLASGHISFLLNLTMGETFPLESFEIGIPGPVQVQ